MNVYILAAGEMGLNTCEILRSRGMPIRGIIGLSQRLASDAISGYCHAGDYCARHHLEFIEVESYALSAARDRERLLQMSIDVLLVINWQRLVPAWLIEHCRICAVGAHGSAQGITSGRGRSPQNWALLLGKKEFSLSIFRIDVGIDSGPIFASCTFPLTEQDDIRSSYYKTVWCVAEMIADHFDRIQTGQAEHQEGNALYLPQRLPEDGAIDWRRPAGELYDFIRALTRPYPGAHSTWAGGRMTFWRARVFSLGRRVTATPGTVMQTFFNGDLLIQTGTDMLLVDDCSCEGPRPESGVVLDSVGFPEQIRRIVTRHLDKWPALPLSAEVTRLLSA